MSRWRVVKNHRGTIKAGGKYYGPGDFIAYTEQLEQAGLIEELPEPEVEKPAPKAKKPTKKDKGD